MAPVSRTVCLQFQKNVGASVPKSPHVILNRDVRHSTEGKWRPRIYWKKKRVLIEDLLNKFRTSVYNMVTIVNNNIIIFLKIDESRF